MLRILKTTMINGTTGHLNFELCSSSLARSLGRSIVRSVAKSLDSLSAARSWLGAWQTRPPSRSILIHHVHLHHPLIRPSTVHSSVLTIHSHPQHRLLVHVSDRPSLQTYHRPDVRPIIDSSVRRPIVRPLCPLARPRHPLAEKRSISTLIHPRPGCKSSSNGFHYKLERRTLGCCVQHQDR